MGPSMWLSLIDTDLTTLKTIKLTAYSGIWKERKQSSYIILAVSTLENEMVLSLDGGLGVGQGGFRPDTTCC